MECRERVLAALNLEEPDRVPCHTILIDGNNVDEILGKPQISDFEVFTKIRNESSDWVNEMSNLIESTEASVFSRCVEAAAVIGLDCMQVGTIPYFILDSPDDKIMMGDIFGRVWEARDNEGNINPYYLHGTMDSVEKWKDEKDKFEGEYIKKYKKIVNKFYRRINKKHKDKIFVAVTNDYMGVFESTSQGMGMTYFSKMLHKNPKFIKEVMDVYARFLAELYMSYMDA